MKKTRTSATALAAAVLTALVLAGCGSDEPAASESTASTASEASTTPEATPTPEASTSSEAATTPEASTASEASTSSEAATTPEGTAAPEATAATVASEGTLSAATVATFADYSGAEPGTASSEGDSIRIGWVNQDSGPGGTPELTEQFEDSIALVNSELSGAGGTPIEIDACDIASEEDGQSCAQRFANDDSIVAIAQGNIAIGTASFHSIIDPAGIPLVGAIPLGPEDGASPNGFYLAGGSFSTIPATVSLLAGGFIDAESVAVITVAGEFVSTEIGNQLAGVLSSTGLDVRTAAIELTSTDVTAPLIAAGADTADVIIPLVILPPQCVAVSDALDLLDTDATVLALSACYSQGVKEALGDYPQWAYTSGFVLPGVADPDPEVQAQVDAYGEWYATHDYELEAVIPLQTALAVQRHLIEAGGADATRESFIEVARAWTGPVFMGVPDVQYGSVTVPFPLPALPSLALRAYQYNGDGDFVDLTDGEWVG
jgi:hypothetical protein